MSTEITLTKDQSEAFKLVKNTFADEDEPAVLLKGCAGTGKSTLTRYIVDWLKEKKMHIAVLAPTHKARRVVEKFLNENRFMPVPTMTVASILGKIKEHSYIGTKKYTRGCTQKMEDYDCFILDEVSMVSDKDLAVILDFVCLHDKKIILIGDDCQIPSPSQSIIKVKNKCFKPDSEAFNILNSYNLTQIVRQKEDSYILKLATFIRDNIECDYGIRDILTRIDIDKDELLLVTDNLYKYVMEDLKNEKESTRVVAYTNAAVRNHNKEIRHRLQYEEAYVLGELLMGYANVGYRPTIIENGSDYLVASREYIYNKSINHYKNLVGYKMTLINLNDNSRFPNLFFIDINHSNNVTFMKEVVKRAEKVNSHYSTKNDYKNYCKLKNQTIFIDDVYTYKNKICTEIEFTQLHPLLFTKINEVIDEDTKNKLEGELVEKIESIYEDIIEDRIMDNKMYSDGEVLADRFKVIEKDIYYGYSITSHKAQGSTYNNVYVDEQDFKKVRNRWNYRFNAREERIKERNQLRYVAYTRASNKLKIFMPEF